MLWQKGLLQIKFSDASNFIMVRHKNLSSVTLKDKSWHSAILLLQDLMSDNNEWKGEATAKEQHHHAQQAPLVLH